jgi:UDP-glucose 4-epimerase
MRDATHIDERFRDAATLVTGGCGFIGSHLVERLVACGAHVTVLDNLKAGTPQNLAAVCHRVRIEVADVRDAEQVERIITVTRPRYVFHLAANASVPGSVEDPVYDFETNCAGSFVLLDALRGRSECEKLVVASSGAVYGEPVRFPIRETDALRPISPYGASKLSAEIQARAFQQVYGVPAVVARLFNTYGPRMARFVVLDFLRKLQQDPDVLEILGSGQQVRDFTYVADTVEALLVLAAQGTAGEAYNISSGTSYSVTELATMLLAALGLAGRTHLQYTGKSWVGDAQEWRVCIRKARRSGYTPRWSLPEGLQRTIEWFGTAMGPTASSPRRLIPENRDATADHFVHHDAFLRLRMDRAADPATADHDARRADP